MTPDKPTDETNEALQLAGRCYGNTLSVIEGEITAFLRPRFSLQGIGRDVEGARSEETMTPSREEEIEKRLAAATPGPWSKGRDNWIVSDPRNGIVVAASMQTAHNQELIAHAPADIRYLLARVRADAVLIGELGTMLGLAVTGIELALSKKPGLTFPDAEVEALMRNALNQTSAALALIPRTTEN